MAQWKINFSDLEFGDRRGKGNFGEVYKGTYLGTDVAIKRLFFIDDDFMQKYIEREMEILTQLNHPNIVQLIGLCVGLEDLYIITEFVHGGSLHAKLEDGSAKMDWKSRVGILRDVALAMNYLHAKGKMHRDLKSHNLLVTADGKIKVCDFGLARSTNEEGGGGGGGNQKTIVGTNEWMAPEVQAGDNYDSSADVFSYGMVVWELIAREEPPVRKLRDGYAFIPETYKPKIPNDTPPKLWEILVDCAKTEPKERPDFKAVVNRIKEIYDLVPNDGAGASAPVSVGEKKTTAPAPAEKKPPATAPEKKAPTTTTAEKKATTTPEKKPSTKRKITKKKKKPKKKDGDGEKSTKKKVRRPKKKETTTKKTTTKK